MDESKKFNLSFAEGRHEIRFLERQRRKREARKEDATEIGLNSLLLLLSNVSILTQYGEEDAIKDGVAVIRRIINPYLKRFYREDEGIEIEIGDDDSCEETICKWLCA